LVPIVLITARTPGTWRKMSSTSRTLASVYCRLEPIGVLTRIDMMPSSLSGTNSLPTQGTKAKLPKNVPTASSTNSARGLKLFQRVRFEPSGR
jgi:hypothetical protein